MWLARIQKLVEIIDRIHQTVRSGLRWLDPRRFVSPTDLAEEDLGHVVKFGDGEVGRVSQWITPRPGRPVGAILIGVLAVAGILAFVEADPDSPAARDARATQLIVAVSSEFPVAMNDRVEKWMRRFLTGQREEFQWYLSREAIYADFIRGRLRDRGMPEGLLYLAMIESGFVPDARSRAEAIGVWQFVGATAVEYGLRVDGYVDERRDPIRATDAALDYLEALHTRFDGSWHLAAAAYNAGPTRVARILRTHAGDRIGEEDLYWDVINHLPPDTREYVPKIIAAKLVASNAEAYGFIMDKAEAYAFETVWVPGRTSLSDVSRSIGLESGSLQELNPHLLLGLTPPGESYPVRVPMGHTTRVVAALNQRRPWGGWRADDD